MAGSRQWFPRVVHKRPAADRLERIALADRAARRRSGGRVGRREDLAVDPLELERLPLSRPNVMLAVQLWKPESNITII
jgi:hypothetical protein